MDTASSDLKSKKQTFGIVLTELPPMGTGTFEMLIVVCQCNYDKA